MRTARRLAPAILCAPIGLSTAVLFEAQTEASDISEDYATQIQIDTIAVKRILLEGNTLLSPDIVDQVTQQFAGRNLSYEELRGARDALTRLYIDRGYINSGVTISDQEVVDGTVIMTAVEGSLGKINLTGNRWLRDRYIESRLHQELSNALQIADLEAALRTLQDGSMIRRVNATLVPGAQRGISDLDLAVVENAPMSISFDANNHRAPSVGEYQGAFSFAHRSLTGNGDYLQANYALGDGVDDYGLLYGLPLNARDLTAEAYYRRGNSDIIESGFDTLDITSDIETWGLRLHQPVHVQGSQSIVLGLGFEHTATESGLLGEAFSFSPGEIDGRSKVSLLRASVEWSLGREEDAFSLYAAVNQGVDWLDASDAAEVPGIAGSDLDAIPDSDFTSVVTQLNYVRRLPWADARAYLSLGAQYTDDPLLPAQQMTIGGAASVRGYRENQLVRDTGVTARAELRIPILNENPTMSRLGLSFAPFVDYGRAKNRPVDLPGFARPEADELASVGAGLVAVGLEPLVFEVFYGEPLIDVDNPGNSLQEQGWHIRAYLSWALPGGL